MRGKKSNLISRLPSDLLSERAFQAPAYGMGGRVDVSGWRAACVLSPGPGGLLPALPLPLL